MAKFLPIHRSRILNEVTVSRTKLETGQMIKFRYKKKNGDADLYFFGFKSELADSSDFLSLIARSNSIYNYSNYTNEMVDSFIVSSLIEIQENKRITAVRIITPETGRFISWD